MRKLSTIKKLLERKGYTIIERDGTLVMAQEVQRETLECLNDDGSVFFMYAPSVYLTEDGTDYTFLINKQIEEITGTEHAWECQVPYEFVLFEV